MKDARHVIPDKLRELAKTDPRYAMILDRKLAMLDIPSPSPNATPPPAPVRNSLLECRELINSCDYRGPVIVGGCSCTRLCWLGKGYNPEKQPFGQVKDLDCLTCVRSNE